ncbi:hypothetical protein GSI_02739 [Ganoderma sinense ZZ0214-1]|uniref:Uncharacterized protein n=1 Tax=Ganoderma sinense ZZ0214-1 TaxID=1077348 RepID=A0A2G8SMG2_9APHY|nr:hypothetical protein GSI_02739 [Ganoderma sinense ZZ0214-1]
MVQRIDLGAREQRFVLLDDTYVLVLPQHHDSGAHSDSEPHLTVFRLSPSSPSSPICVFQLPSVTLRPGEIIAGRSMCTSRHPPVPEGHFHDDPSMSMVVLMHYINIETQSHPIRCRVSHLLIPCAALLAQIRAVFDSNPDPLAPPRLVPWRDWGPHRSLRLVLPVHPHPDHISDYLSLIPYGSRMPVVTFDDPGCTRASVYVFDINPLVVRHALHTLASQSESGESTTATAIVEDVEAVLPGVVDPENSAIPFVVYRFGIPLPAVERPTWRVIQAVRMSMTGFTVTFGLGLRETDHTWTV